MTTADEQGPVTMQERIVSSLATAHALAKLLIEKGLITEAEFMEKRIPLPRKSGGPQTTKKGKKGYNRRREKDRLCEEAKGIRL